MPAEESSSAAQPAVDRSRIDEIVRRFVDRQLPPADDPPPERPPWRIEPTVKVAAEGDKRPVFRVD